LFWNRIWLIPIVCEKTNRGVLITQTTLFIGLKRQLLKTHYYSMRKFFTPLLPKGNKQQTAALPALLKRYLLSNLNFPYPYRIIGLKYTNQFFLNPLSFS